MGVKAFLGEAGHRSRLERILAFANVDLNDPEAIKRKWPEAQLPVYGTDGSVAIMGGAFQEVSYSLAGTTVLWPKIPRLPRRHHNKLQSEFRNFLDQIIENEEIPPELYPVLNKALASTADEKRIEPNGGLEVWPIPTNLRNWYLYGIAAIQAMRVADKVRQCALEECNLYFIDWPGLRGHAGRPKTYCARLHADRDRSRRRREKERHRAAENRKRKKRESRARGIAI